MPPRIFHPGRLFRLIILAGALLPASTRAQIGLTGNALSGQAEEMRGNTPFNKGFQSKSALGQLEELTGSKVDRSSPDRPPPPRAAPKISRSAQMRNELNQEVAGMLASALVQMLFSDDSAKKKAADDAAAAEAAAQAAAQAEAFRVQQELARLARIQMAQRYRAEWDDRETEIGDRLGGAFTVATGTDFFGQPAGPDASTAALLSAVGDADTPTAGEPADLSEGDPSVVDLRESSLVVQPFPQPQPAVTPGRSRPMTRIGSRAPDWATEPPETGSVSSPRNARKLRSQMLSLLAGKVTDLELAYLFMGIKELGGDSVQALASLPEKAKEAIDLKKKISDHITDFLNGIFSIAGQAANPRANLAALADLSVGRLQSGADNFGDDARGGISNNLMINLSGTVPDDSPAAVGMGSAQAQLTDIQELLKWGRDTSGTR